MVRIMKRPTKAIKALVDEVKDPTFKDCKKVVDYVYFLEMSLKISEEYASKHAALYIKQQNKK